MGDHGTVVNLYIAVYTQHFGVYIVMYIVNAKKAYRTHPVLDDNYSVKFTVTGLSRIVHLVRMYPGFGPIANNRTGTL